MSAKFDPDITLGNLISISTILCALAVGWGVHTSTVQMLQANDKRQDIMVEQNRIAISQLQLSNASVAAELRYIREGVDDLKKQPR